jgi:hypothetical protein
MKKSFSGIARKLFVGIFLSLFILALSACQTVKLDTFNKNYAAGMTAISAVYSIAANGVEVGKISKEDGQRILQGADKVRHLFGEARIAYNIDQKGGMAALNVAVMALNVLQDELGQVSKP